MLNNNRTIFQSPKIIPLFEISLSFKDHSYARKVILNEFINVYDPIETCAVTLVDK